MEHYETDSAEHSQRLIERARAVDNDPELRAIDALFLLASKPIERYVPAIQAFDWTQFPRARGFGLHRASQMPRGELHDAAKKFFETAIGELLQRKGTSGVGGSSLRVMRLRLEDVSAAELSDRLEEWRIPQRGTKTYRYWIKAYGYEQIRDWAVSAVSATQTENGSEPSATDTTSSPSVGGEDRIGSRLAPPKPADSSSASGNFGSRPGQIPIATTTSPKAAPGTRTVWAAIFALTLATGLLSWRIIHTPPVLEILVEYLGLHVEMDRGGEWYRPKMSEVVSKRQLPNLGSPLRSLAVIAPEHVRRSADAAVPLSAVRFVLGTDNSGSSPATVALWEPLSEKVLWKYSFRVRPGEAEMHDDLPPEVGSEPYRVRWLAHSSPYATLGPNCVVAVFQQRWSPHFAVFLDLETGDELARYGSYGELGWPLIVDVDRDGEPEVVLSGCDNLCDCAAVTVLDPTMRDGASASVKWNMEGEAAKWRVLFPDPRTLERIRTLPLEFAVWKDEPNPDRLHTVELGPRSWDARNEMLRLSVGTAPSKRAYYTLLKNGLPQSGVQTAQLGDAEARLWRQLGLHPSEDLEELVGRIQILRTGDMRACP